MTDRVALPDLLHPAPLTRIDVELTTTTLALAFASGVSGGLFAEALDAATVGASTWEPAAFANDLFLKNFVSLCFRARVGAGPREGGGHHEPALSVNHLVKVLAHPPRDPAVVAYRRAVLTELLAVKEQREALERVYLALARFRSLIEGASGAGRWDANRRQLDVLTVAKQIIDAMAEGFTGATSGLARLKAFGEEVQRGEGYRSLGDLLRYDERLATLDLKVSVGADGRIRGFDIVAVEEHTENPFVSSPLRRFFTKVELFLRGFRFNDSEVMARLIDAVFEGVKAELVAFVQLLGDVEFYLGALGFHDRAGEAGLSVCLPKLVAAGPQEPLALLGLWNPLLLAHGTTPVPCDLESDKHQVTVLVTGPNSGGKTRLLQSLGLTQLLAQGGVFVPAREASLSVVPALVVSLIQETKADQAEGRLGMELVRIRDLFERLPPGAMVILDELCSGTNPSEGEEIFELVIRMLTRLTPQAFITTHFLAFAARLERERTIADLRFVQVALGPDQRPTYQFSPGVAHTSLAGQAAARLGVTGDQLMALVERNIALARAAVPARES